MLYSREEMPIVFVLARDWALRTAVRAELREIGIDALGMDSPDDAGRAIAAGEMPGAIVLEATGDFLSHPAIRNLIARVPSILIASRTERIPLPAGGGGKNRGLVLYRPVRIGEIVSSVRDFLQKGQAA